MDKGKIFQTAIIPASNIEGVIICENHHFVSPHNIIHPGNQGEKLMGNFIMDGPWLKTPEPPDIL